MPKIPLPVTLTELDQAQLNEWVRAQYTPQQVVLRARIVLCGLIAQYNAVEPVPGPYNFVNVLSRRARIEGFIVLDYVNRTQEAMTQIEWAASLIGSPPVTGISPVCRKLIIRSAASV